MGTTTSPLHPRYHGLGPTPLDYQKAVGPLFGANAPILTPWHRQANPSFWRVGRFMASGAFLRICRLTQPRVWLVSDAAVSCQLYWELGRLDTVQRRLRDARFSEPDVYGYYRCGWLGKFLSAC